MSDGSTSEVEALRERVRRLEEALAIARVVPWEWHIAEDRVAPAVDQEVLRPYVEYPEVPANLAGFLTVVHPDDRDSVRASLRATLEEDAPYVACYRLAADRHDMWVEARGVLYRDDAGNPVRLVGIAQDIRERKALEDKVQHSQMIEALGLFAGGLAHDFNNLLTVIRLNTELLASALASKGMVQTVPVSLLDIRQAAERGAELTRQLLAVSRRQFLARTPTDLSRVLDSVISLTRRLVPENIELVLDRPAGECFVLGDPSQFAQVLLNLILNARDAMPEGGSIEVTLGPATLSVQRAAAMGVRAGEHARLRVKDTGVGMDPETMARLFEPFFTTKGVGKGSGLGLATVHGTVALLGGAVEVDSTPGRGSTFDVYLPLTDARPPAAATRPPPGDLAGHAEAILVVDDDEAVRTAVCRVLRHEGYRVADAASPRLALGTSPPGETAIQLLVTDVVLPGMNGVELATQLGNRLPDLKVLFMTGYTEDDTLRTGLSESHMRVLHKPFTPDALLQAVHDALVAR